MDIFTTSSGRVIPLRRVSRFYLAKIGAKHPLPDTPTYTFKAAGGTDVEKPHDETTLESPEDHKAWNEHVTECERIEGERIDETMNFLMCNCIAEEPPPVEEWSVDFDLWDLEKPDPEDVIQFKVQWINLELVPDPADFSRLIAKAYEMAGMLQGKVVREFEEFFRFHLEREESSRAEDRAAEGAEAAD